MLVSVHFDRRAEAQRPSKGRKLYIAPRQWNSRNHGSEPGSAAGAGWGCATIQPLPGFLGKLLPAMRGSRRGAFRRKNRIRAPAEENRSMMADRVIFVCTIVIAAVYFYATTLIPALEIGDPLGPKAFPRLLGVCLLIAAGLLFIELWKDRKAAAPPTPLAGTGDLRHLGALAAVTVWTAAFYVVFEKAGYIVATSVYLLALMAWFNRGQVDRQRDERGAVQHPELRHVPQARRQAAARHPAVLRGRWNRPWSTSSTVSRFACSRSICGTRSSAVSSARSSACCPASAPPPASRC